MNAEHAKIGKGTGRHYYPVVPIEKGIPIPPPRADRVKRAYYPWADMEVGDSIVVLTPNASNVSSLMRQASEKHGMAFVMRRIVSENGYFRVWRVE